ncbi:MAG: fatty acid desaturase [Acidimicrobiia bacterium]|nr:fatty acid desaturase [Acidimicrobiia bacterium]
MATTPIGADPEAEVRRALPSLHELGADLLVLSPARRALLVGRPFVLGAAYIGFAAAGLWLPALVCLALCFPSVITAVHDATHANLGVRRRTNDRLLSVLATVIFTSGHAVQATHRAHHRHLLSADDPEGYVDQLPMWRAFVEGPIYQYRLWQWARASHPELRRTVGREALGHVVLGIGSVAVLPWTIVPFVWTVVMLAGTTVFPVFGVKLVHDGRAEHAIDRSRTFRSRLLQFLVAGTLYHREHHLFPRVPTPHCAELARRLAPHLAAIRASATDPRRPSRGPWRSSGSWQRRGTRRSAA